MGLLSSTEGSSWTLSCMWFLRSCPAMTASTSKTLLHLAMMCSCSQLMPLVLGKEHGRHVEQLTRDMDDGVVKPCQMQAKSKHSWLSWFLDPSKGINGVWSVSIMKPCCPEHTQKTSRRPTLQKPPFKDSEYDNHGNSCNQACWKLLPFPYSILDGNL